MAEAVPGGETGRRQKGRALAQVALVPFQMQARAGYGRVVRTSRVAGNGTAAMAGSIAGAGRLAVRRKGKVGPQMGVGAAVVHHQNVGGARHESPDHAGQGRSVVVDRHHCQNADIRAHVVFPRLLLIRARLSHKMPLPPRARAA